MGSVEGWMQPNQQRQSNEGKFSNLINFPGLTVTSLDVTAEN